MCNQLKTLNSDQLEQYIKERVDRYLGIDCTCKVKDFDTAYVNAKGNKLTFRVEICYDENEEGVATSP